VLYPYHVVQTKYGIVWLNSSGLFLYDGKSIKNLILGKLKQESIVGYVSDTTVLFYDTNYDVVIVNGASQSLIYSFLTDSFSTAESYGLTSNPVTSYDGDTLLLVSSGSDAVLKRYSHTTTSKTYTLTTKTFDFGTTSLYKKVYSITITYTLSGGTAAVYYNIGDSNVLIGNLSSTSGPESIKLNISGGIRCKSIKFVIEGNGIFELHNMFIEYRVIGR